MSNEADLQQIELGLENAQGMVELYEAFERLRNNADFKAVIEDGYFNDEAVRLVAAKSNPNLSAEDQVQIDHDIMGVGRLRQYFMALTAQGRSAENAIKAYKAERELIHEEEAAE